LLDEPKNQKNAEWTILKEIQRTERTDFFAEGKSEFSALRSAIYREMREDFRDRWSDFMRLKEAARIIRTVWPPEADLVAEQKAVLEARRDEACNELRNPATSAIANFWTVKVKFALTCAGARGRSRQCALPSGNRDRNAPKDMTAGFREAADQSQHRSPAANGTQTPAGPKTRAPA